MRKLITVQKHNKLHRIYDIDEDRIKPKNRKWGIFDNYNINSY